MKNNLIEIDQDFLNHNSISAEVFKFNNIKYYELLNPIKVNSIYNVKFIRLKFNKYLEDGITQIAYESITIEKKYIKNLSDIFNLVSNKNQN